MMNLSDVSEAFDALCPACDKAVRGALLEALAKRRRRDPSKLSALRREAATAFGITEEDLVGPGKSSYYVRARRQFFVAARKSGFSLHEIGRAIGMHHTSVFYALKSGEKGVS